MNSFVKRVGVLRRQLRPGLLRHHVRGVPVWPVLVALPGALLMLAMGSLRPPKPACQIAGGGERSRGSFNAPWKPGRDFLQQPAVSVGIAEGGEGTVGGVIRRGPCYATGRLELSFRRPGVEYLAHCDTASHQLCARSLDVGDDQV